MKKNKNLTILVKIHKFIGLAVCLFLIHLSISGILLNHTNDLKLDQHRVSWDWLLKSYGIPTPETQSAYAVGENFLHQTNNQIFMNEKSIIRNEAGLMGALLHNNDITIATADSIIEINASGDILRNIKVADAFNNGIRRIGLLSNSIVIESNNIYFVQEVNSNKWLPKEDLTGIKWANKQTLPADLKNKIKKYYVGDGLSVEQIILELHSGAIFKKIGRTFMDVIAILLIILSASGIWMWFLKKKG
ncbi:MAG: PepSY domain-containing protein [Methylophilales bacterium]|nr:PepSY domain-containing protein [Methylophilales bacterium]